MEQNRRMSSPAKRVPLLIALVGAAVFAHAAVPGPDAARIRVLAERLPERPGTPGVSPADRERTEDGWVLTREAGKVGISAVVSGGDWDWKVDELDNFEAMP